MYFDDVMDYLEEHGNENTKKIFTRHGAREPFFGVKVGDLKVIVKKIKKDYELSKKLYDTGNSDAMYLAGLIADETKMTKVELQNWAGKAYWYMLSEYTVPYVAQESGYKYELAREWMKSDKEGICSAGWSTFAGIIAIDENETLPFEEILELLTFIEKNIHDCQNRVRYTMNGFVIAAGSYIPELHERAKEVAGVIGKVKVDMGGTSCKVPFAVEYIQKIVDMGRLGRKRKAARC
ncbi:MAG: DNA alkylation repair protein [Spirochaetales bacterium]|nr:DNA alkylation repair protein [Spirochaetales bacterium]